MANWQLENYGEDIDGNRGLKTWFCTLEPQDDEYVLTQLSQMTEEYSPIDYLPEKVEISITNPFTEEDQTITIDTEPYLEKLRLFQFINPNNYKDFVKSLIDLDRELALKTALFMIEQLSKK